MIPINQIREGDQFQMSWPHRNIYHVIEVNENEKMIKIQAYSYPELKPIMKPFWKSNKDRLFSEQYRFPYAMA